MHTQVHIHGPIHTCTHMHAHAGAHLRSYTHVYTHACTRRCTSTVLYTPSLPQHASSPLHHHCLQVMRLTCARKRTNDRSPSSNSSAMCLLQMAIRVCWMRSKIVSEVGDSSKSLSQVGSTCGCPVGDSSGSSAAQVPTNLPAMPAPGNWRSVAEKAWTPSATLSKPFNARPLTRSS